ncbi:MAG: hypothetical protein JXA89_11295 [Anaerolineae bacterium]|nr:hypothetical protein [Anaerolineae bacterium]
MFVRDGGVVAVAAGVAVGCGTVHAGSNKIPKIAHNTFDNRFRVFLVAITEVVILGWRDLAIRPKC